MQSQFRFTFRMTSSPTTFKSTLLVTQRRRVSKPIRQTSPPHAAMADHPRYYLEDKRQATASIGVPHTLTPSLKWAETPRFSPFLDTVRDWQFRPGNPLVKRCHRYGNHATTTTITKSHTMGFEFWQSVKTQAVWATIWRAGWIVEDSPLQLIISIFTVTKMKFPWLNKKERFTTKIWKGHFFSFADG